MCYGSAWSEVHLFRCLIYAIHVWRLRLLQNGRSIPVSLGIISKLAAGTQRMPSGCRMLVVVAKASNCVSGQCTSNAHCSWTVCSSLKPACASTCIASFVGGGARMAARALGGA